MNVVVLVSHERYQNSKFPLGFVPFLASPLKKARKSSWRWRLSLSFRLTLATSWPSTFITTFLHLPLPGFFFSIFLVFICFSFVYLMFFSLVHFYFSLHICSFGFDFKNFFFLLEFLFSFFFFVNTACSV